MVEVTGGLFHTVYTAYTVPHSVLLCTSLIPHNTIRLKTASVKRMCGKFALEDSVSGQPIVTRGRDFNQSGNQSIDCWPTGDVYDRKAVSAANSFWAEPATGYGNHRNITQEPCSEACAPVAA